MASTKFDDLADALEALLRGVLTEEQFRRQNPTRTAGRDLEPVLANIEHFLADADIRARDPRYKAMQEGAVSKVITALRSGDVNMARHISFLGR